MLSNGKFSPFLIENWKFLILFFVVDNDVMVRAGWRLNPHQTSENSEAACLIVIMLSLLISRLIHY